jgi:hypothetical protein
MIAWFVAFITAQPASVLDECLVLAKRLGLGESFVAECRKLAERPGILEPIR